MHLVIDGDQMIFSCGFATEGEPISHTFHAVDEYIRKVVDKSGCQTYQVYIKGVGNFRDEVCANYKGNRTARKPLCYDDIYGYLVDKYEAIAVDGMEVDDIVSHLLWQDFKDGGEPADCTVVLFSPDKDLKNTPGWHLDLKHDDPYWINELQASRHFIYQLLRGDPVDNIQGLETIPRHIKEDLKLRSIRCGEATAKKLMATTTGVNDALHLAALLYLLQDGSLHNFQKNATLLWMARDLVDDKPDSPWDHMDTSPVADAIADYGYEYRKLTEGEKEAITTRAESLSREGIKETEVLMPSLWRTSPAGGGDTGPLSQDGKGEGGTAQEL